MAKVYDAVNVQALVVGGNIETTRNGSRFMSISHEQPGRQFKDVQLGRDVYDTSRVLFKVESGGVGAMQLKIEPSPGVVDFVTQMEGHLREQVLRNPSLSEYTFNSLINENDRGRVLKLKLYADTQIYSMTLSNDPSAEHTVSPATISDIRSQDRVLPIVKIGGGIYFLEKNETRSPMCGVSLLVSSLLIVKQDAPVAFAFGNVNVRL